MKRQVSAEHGFIFRKMLWAINMVYSAELSGDGKKRQSWKKKLVVENGNTGKRCIL